MSKLRFGVDEFFTSTTALQNPRLYAIGWHGGPSDQEGGAVRAAAGAPRPPDGRQRGSAPGRGRDKDNSLFSRQDFSFMWHCPGTVSEANAGHKKVWRAPVCRFVVIVFIVRPFLKFENFSAMIHLHISCSAP